MASTYLKHEVSWGYTHSSQCTSRTSYGTIPDYFRNQPGGCTSTNLSPYSPENVTGITEVNMDIDIYGSKCVETEIICFLPHKAMDEHRHVLWDWSSIHTKCYLSINCCCLFEHQIFTLITLNPILNYNIDQFTFKSFIYYFTPLLV